MANDKNGSMDILAYYGGVAVRSEPMPVRHAFGPDERGMIDEFCRYYNEHGQDPGYQGHFEERYCQLITSSLGGGYADSVATGTAAVYVAIAALGLPKGAEVLVSPITDPGSVNAIIHAGLKPKLMDTYPGSYNVGVEEVVSRIGPNTRAALIVHAAGQACEIDAIVRECHSRDVRVVEDCSQAHMARWKGRPVGTFGDIAAYSTMYRKASISGGAGGVVYTRDQDLFYMALAHADRGKTPWVEGFDDKDPGQFLFPALNLHSDEISCAIGISSWQRLEETISRRMDYVRGLDALIGNTKACRPYGWSAEDSPFFYPIVVDVEALPVDKKVFAEMVASEGIGLNPHYMYLLADWAYLKPYLADVFETPNARKIRDSSFNLFVNENYGAQEVSDTIEAIVKVESAVF